MMNINKINPDHLKKILENFDYKEEQIPRIKQILFDNHIENFQNYYSIFPDCKKVNFVDEFYEIYKLDIQVRRVLFSAIGRFEISLKTKFATFMTQKYGDGSIWSKKNFNSKKVSEYLSAINWTTKRMKRKYDFKSEKGRFFNKKGKEIFFPNYQGLHHSTLGNTIHLVFSLYETDKKLFNDIYFDKLEYKNFDIFLHRMNDFRNHIVHIGRIINDKKIFSHDVNIKSILGDKILFDKESEYSFIIMFYKFMGKIPTQTLMKNFKELFSNEKYEKFSKLYGYDKELHKKLNIVLGEENEKSQY